MYLYLSVILSAYWFLFLHILGLYFLGLLGLLYLLLHL